ncbi:hypothetical protein EIN_087480 [Entamoeba invadens IP1]|uniref:hypothetical protein n=1 Tax=Entamoeba invadens IP1 TaxID=370355 RepID=UPI0002C3DCBA|nr:hypothetical protein EIN_087480 [Entamoeba invadens IP1]ELP85436.1 hypothetical protein EIN_087480 [Entamoeba invadens IP1]|eukprot:XP_004184782.1 hypothetical protein EIN_087480 [Entamoeba invadens IP1]
MRTVENTSPILVSYAQTPSPTTLESTPKLSPHLHTHNTSPVCSRSSPCLYQRGQSVFSVVNKIQKDQILDELFIQPHSQLLYAYCNVFIRTNYNEKYTRTLLYYFSSRGKLVDLLNRIISIELETVDEDQLFTKTGIFVPIFSSYVSLFCGSYRNNLKMSYQRKLKEKKINDQLEEKEPFNTFYETIADDFKNIPTHFVIVMSRLFKTVSKALGKRYSIETVRSLFVLNIVEPIIKGTPLVNSLNQMTTNHLTRFIHRVVLEMISTPLSVIRETQVDFELQEKTSTEIVQIMKSNMICLSKFYPGDFSIIFNCVKGVRTHGQVTLIDATSGYLEWTDSKENVLKTENLNLTTRNNQLKTSISLLKEKVQNNTLWITKDHFSHKVELSCK